MFSSIPAYYTVKHKTVFSKPFNP